MSEAKHVDVWTGTLAQPRAAIDRFTTLLSVEEQDRASRFGKPQLRDRYIAGRGLLREILSRSLETDPRAIELEYGLNGKPSLAGRSLPAFNVSHSGDLFACAVSTVDHVGVDVEQMRVVSDLEGLARRFFSPAEIAALVEFPEFERQSAFLRCWTRKEAFLKATGEGFAGGLNSFAVSLGTEAGLLWTERSGRAEEWTLLAFEPAPGAFGAGAVHTQNATLKLRAL